MRTKRRFRYRLLRLLRSTEWQRHAIVIAFCFLAALLMTQESPYRRYFFEVGKTWRYATLYAPFDFPIKKPRALYKRELDSLRKNFPEPFFHRPENSHLGLSRLQQLIAFLDTAQSPNAAALSWLNKEVLHYCMKHRKMVLPLLRNYAVELKRIYTTPILDKRIEAIRSPVVSLRSEEGIAILYEKQRLKSVYDLRKRFQKQFPVAIARPLLLATLLPTYEWNAQVYYQELSILEKQISPYYGKVHRGTLIIRKGEQVTPQEARILASLNEALEQRQKHTSPLVAFLGRLVLITALAYFNLFYIQVKRRNVYRSVRNVGLIYSVYLLTLLFTAAIVHLNERMGSALNVDLQWVAPLSLAPIVLTIFFDDGIGFYGNLLITLLSALQVPYGFDLFFVQSAAGSVAVFSLMRLQKRRQFFIAIGFTLLTYVVLYLALSFFEYGGNLREIKYVNLVLFFINVLLLIGVYPLIYLFEKIFGIASDLSYLELLDMNHPLLKKLSLKAPGTYQHSIQVANLAEACANRIRINALLVRVGALFHDIGKLHAPEYFIENQKPSQNPHQRLTPKESAQIIIRHVSYGVELAEKYGLPEPIIRFIKTHHGTTRVSYFYYLHSQQVANHALDEAAFRYPGPLPRTKEEVLLMIVDSVEAASRTLNQPTAEEIEQLVDRVIQDKLSQRQFVNSQLSFWELYTIRSELIKQLQSMLHTRIAYPSLERA